MARSQLKIGKKNRDKLLASIHHLYMDPPGIKP